MRKRVTAKSIDFKSLFGDENYSNPKRKVVVARGTISIRELT